MAPDKTAVERQERYRGEQNRRGLARISVWVPTHLSDALKEYAAHLRECWVMTKRKEKA